MSQVTKETILQSASKLFGNRTPSAVSLREIAKEANVSKSLILKYWGSRTGFVIAVLEHERYKIRDVWEGVDRDTSVQEICIRLLTAFQANPRYFNLITRVALEDIDPEIEKWLSERMVYSQIHEVVERLEQASIGNETVKRWSPEALSVFAMICSFALPVLGPKIMNWYNFPEKNRRRIEQEVMMLCITAMMSHIED
ncbi:MAG: TetR/AcrR family transcriptional regulator [Myxococcota bacterium]